MLKNTTCDILIIESRFGGKEVKMTNRSFRDIDSVMFSHKEVDDGSLPNRRRARVSVLRRERNSTGLPSERLQSGSLQHRKPRDNQTH